MLLPNDTEQIDVSIVDSEIGKYSSGSTVYPQLTLKVLYDLQTLALLGGQIYCKTSSKVRSQSSIMLWAI